MDIREALAGVASYSHLADRDQAAQRHLGDVRRNPPSEFPIGLRVLVSGSGQSLPLVPWIALLDKDVTETAQDGLYLCYLFTQDLDGVYLSMNQGATQHLRVATDAGHKGRAAERAAIEEETRLLLRSLLADVQPPGSETQIDLRSRALLPLAYEVGNVAGVHCSLSALPAAPALADDLSHFGALYSACSAKAFDWRCRSMRRGARERCLSSRTRSRAEARPYVLTCLAEKSR
ncbi:MrcB family domain-containing protein [Geodermatophilus sp. SYSU D00758]